MRWLLAVAILLAPMGVQADPLELGVQLGLPGRGSGIPLMAGEQFAFGVTGRLGLAPYRWARPAIDVSIGTPIAGVGLSLWGGLELRRALLPRLDLYTLAGLRAGFAGPLYYARHSDVFVGFAYIYSGPFTVGPHVPLGVAVKFGRVNAYVEAFVELPLLPTPQLLFGGAAGARVSL